MPTARCGPWTCATATLTLVTPGQDRSSRTALSGAARKRPGTAGSARGHHAASQPRWEHVAGAKYCEGIFEHYIDDEGRVRHRNVFSGLAKTAESPDVLSHGLSSLSTSASPAPQGAGNATQQRVVRCTKPGQKTPHSRIPLAVRRSGSIQKVHNTVMRCSSTTQTRTGSKCTASAQARLNQSSIACCPRRLARRTESVHFN